MHIDISSIDPEQFKIDPNVLDWNDSSGKSGCFLIIPKRIGVKWTQSNKIFRSSLWNVDGDLISASLPKFTNWNENSDHFPVPKDLSNTHIVEKVDGSCLIFSYYNNKYIIRTRGTISAYGMENAHELGVLRAKYPKLFNFADIIVDIKDKSKRNVSIICEWMSPTNQIVIKHQNPDLRLVGVVNHHDYSLYTQKELDYLARTLDVPRPGYSIFGKYESLVEEINKFNNFEGVCIYSNGDQSIHKVKTALYLKKHRFKEHANIESVLDLFIESNCPAYNDFCKVIGDQFDYECLDFVRGFVSQICDAHKEVLTIVDGFAKFISEHKSLARKDFAQKVLANYGATNRAAFLFTLLDKGKLEKDNIKKLMWQVLKK